MNRRKLSSVRAIFSIVPLVCRRSVLLIFAYALLVLAVAVASGLTVYVNQYFYDSLIESVNGGSMSNAVAGAAAVVLMMLLTQVLGKLNGFVWTHLGDKIEYGLIYEYNSKLSRVSPVCFEDPGFLEALAKASDGIYGVIGMFATLCEVALYFGGYFTVTGIYLFNVSPALLIVLLLIFVPSAVSVKLQSRMYAQEADETIPLRRRAASYAGAAANLREVRLFGAFEYFYKLLHDTQHEIFKITRTTEQRNCRTQLILNAVKIAGWLGVSLLMVVELIGGSITVGAFAAVYSSVGEMFSSCENMQKRIKGDISENLGMIEDYIDFLKRPEQKRGQSDLDFGKGIEVRNISFTYPGASHKAVDNVSLKIERGQTIAIVGENGSGKSTLAKLLCGLYVPNEGLVQVWGTDTSSASSELLFSRTSAVFQNYIRYRAMSLYENVTISDTDSDENPVKIMRAAGCPDASLLPRGYDTVMSREFDGAELSGGQWQRTAIARGLYRTNEMIILDEPTAAIDPLEESRIYRLFADIAKGHTCVLITHRLGSAKIADRIIVMDGGHIAEAGTHDELLKINGIYAKMWMTTSERYR